MRVTGARVELYRRLPALIELGTATPRTSPSGTPTLAGGGSSEQQPQEEYEQQQTGSAAA